MTEIKESMKSVSFLNGHLILREHKTGVHYFHEYVTKKIAFMSNKKYKLKVSFFDRNKEHYKEMKKKENKWITSYVEISNAPRILSYILPIEFFFGKHDLYFCDGLFPHTLHKSKKVCLVHDLMVKIYPENYSLIRRAYLNLFFSKLKKADLILAVSENTKRDIMKYYHIPAAKIIVCYNGVNEKKEIFKSNKPTSFNIHRKYLFYVGDMRKNKNLVRTVQGFLNFCEENKVKDLYFYIAGKKSNDYQQICEILKKSKYGKQVKFLGYISGNDKEILYQNCESVVLLSLYEGFGMPIVEGMQYYKPVITSNCSSMKEVGEGATVLADPKSIKDISRAIGDIYFKRFVVDKAIYDKKLAKYNFDNVAEIINSAIEECIN